MGRRRPFMLVALGPMGFCLLLMPFLPTLWVTALVVLAFFFAYYVYEPPYRGLYPDLLPESVYGRAQSAQHLLRGVALGGALVGGGILLKVWTAAPVRARGVRDHGRLRRLRAVRARGAGRARARLRGRARLSRAAAGASSARSRTCGGS